MRHTSPVLARVASNAVLPSLLHAASKGSAPIPIASKSSTTGSPATPSSSPAHHFTDSTVRLYHSPKTLRSDGSHVSSHGLSRHSSVNLSESCNSLATATAAVAPEEGTDAFYAQCHTQFGLPPFSDITVLMFGYGSILWKQNFEFTSEYEVYIKGYKRVFFQGSSDHRGTDEKPGRVVTLLPTSYFAPYTAADDDAAALAQRSSLAREAGLEGSKYEGRVYGKAYQLPSDPKKMYDIFKALDTRETGYACVRVQLFDAHAEKSSADEEEVPLDITTHPGNTDPATMADAAKGKQVICLCYMATTENEHFLGDAPLSTMAEQMVDAVGLSGSNVEYLFFLAEKLREMGAHDPHVYALADEARRILAARAAVQE